MEPVVETRTQTQLEIAQRLLLELFADRERVLISEVRAIAQANQVSFATLSRARHLLGIAHIKNGPLPAFWERKKAARGEHPEPFETTSSESGGASR